MLLFVVRHGIAIDREDPKCPSDPERFLTPDGLKKTREAAKGFAAIEDSPKSKIEKSESLLPGAEPAAFFRELSHKKSLESVICFGHAPQLDELIAYALGSKRDLTALKKAGAACIQLTRLHPPAGTLVWLMTPKALRKLAKGK